MGVAYVLEASLKKLAPMIASAELEGLSSSREALRMKVLGLPDNRTIQDAFNDINALFVRAKKLISSTASSSTPTTSKETPGHPSTSTFRSFMATHYNGIPLSLAFSHCSSIGLRATRIWTNLLLSDRPSFHPKANTWVTTT